MKITWPRCWSWAPRFAGKWRLRSKKPGGLNRIYFVTSLIIIFDGAPGIGWGAEGHRLVGQIAEKYLTAKTEKELRRLLAEEMKTPEPGGLLSRDNVANWADTIRTNPEDKLGIATARWHYINIGTDLKRADFNVNKICPDKNCVVTRLNELQKGETSGVALTPAQRIKFLVHLMGDLHQPLHCAEKDGDRGGNLRMVSFLGQEGLNLHSVWDHEIIRLARKENVSKFLVKEAGVSGSIEDWAWESNRLAANVAYDGISSGKLGRDYYLKVLPVVEDQINKAGHRLAGMLNSIFGN